MRYFLLPSPLKNHVLHADSPPTSTRQDQTRGIIFLFCQFEDEKGKIDANSLGDLLRFVFEIRPPFNLPQLQPPPQSGRKIVFHRIPEMPRKQSHFLRSADPRHRSSCILLLPLLKTRSFLPSFNPFLLAIISKYVLSK